MLGDETSTLDAGTGGAAFKSAGGRAESAMLAAGSVATWLPVSTSEEENSSMDGDEENSSMPGDETAGLDAGNSGATTTATGGRAGLEVLRVGSTESGFPVSSSEEENSPIDGDEGKSSMPGDKTEEVNASTGGATTNTGGSRAVLGKLTGGSTASTLRDTWTVVSGRSSTTTDSRRGLLVSSSSLSRDRVRFWPFAAICSRVESATGGGRSRTPSEGRGTDAAILTTAAAKATHPDDRESVRDTQSALSTRTLRCPDGDSKTVRSGRSVTTDEGA